MRVIFMGTPQFATPTLNMLAEEHEILTVVTQPDRPAGRGKTMQPSAVKMRAQELGLKVSTPASLKSEEVQVDILNQTPDMVIVAAFGQILPTSILESPRFGALNVHASLLPRWRGAAPIQAAILAGDDVTGITIMKMDEGLDTGPILNQVQTTIEPDDTGGNLADRLAHLGAELLQKTIEPYISGEIMEIPQDEDLSTYAPLLKKKDGLLEFNQHSAAHLARQVRAYEPWPGSFFIWKDSRIGVREASILEGSKLAPGEVAQFEGWPVIGCTNHALRLVKIHPAGRRVMSGPEYLRGAPDFVGSML